MSSLPLPTEQQRLYDDAYKSVDSEFGIPDRKITDGRPLTGKRILCVGCGAGNDVWYLAKENEVVGLDYAGSGLEVAERHGIRTHKGDLNLNPLLPFEDESFDIVVCKDILEHLLQPLEVLGEVRRVLRNDGYVVVNVPNQFCLPARLRLLLGQGVLYRSMIENHARGYDEWNYMHIRFFTYRGFQRFLKAARLRPTKWFWDFGNLAHYHQPEMVLEPQIWKRRHGLPLSRRGKLGLYVLRPLWRAFNCVFPRPLRRAIVSLLPGLLCGSFYAHCVKLAGPNGPLRGAALPSAPESLG